MPRSKVGGDVMVRCYSQAGGGSGEMFPKKLAGGGGVWGNALYM